NRRVALKMLRSDGDEQTIARLRREAASVARLQHPNIVQIHEIGTHDGRPFLALELVEGGSLGQRLAARPIPPATGGALVETLARAMQHAHDQGVIHRDLKPANVLLKDVGERTVDEGKTKNPSTFLPKISDFGLAKHLDAASVGLTETGQIMGTPGYMAPEQARARTPVGPAAD